MGLLGEKPMIGPPPKVCPERPVPGWDVVLEPNEDELPGPLLWVVALLNAVAPTTDDAPAVAPAAPIGSPKKPMGGVFC